MIELNEYRPNPLAPSIFVNKIGGLYRVTSNIIKCTLILASPTLAGTVEASERVNLLWEQADAHEANSVLRWVFEEIRNGHMPNWIPDDGGGRRARTQ